MPKNIRTIESAALAGQVRFEKWREKFEREFFEPEAKSAIRTVIASLPPEQLVMLRMMNPEAFDKAMEMIQAEEGV